MDEAYPYPLLDCLTISVLSVPYSHNTEVSPTVTLTPSLSLVGGCSMWVNTIAACCVRGLECSSLTWQARVRVRIRMRISGVTVNTASAAPTAPAADNVITIAFLRTELLYLPE